MIRAVTDAYAEHLRERFGGQPRPARPPGAHPPRGGHRALPPRHGRGADGGPAPAGGRRRRGLRAVRRQALAPRQGEPVPALRRGRPGGPRVRPQGAPGARRLGGQRGDPPRLPGRRAGLRGGGPDDPRQRHRPRVPHGGPGTRPTSSPCSPTRSRRPPAWPSPRRWPRGLPVVASDWDGCRENVVHGETGFLVPTYMVRDACAGATSRLLLGEINYDVFLGECNQAVAVDPVAASEAFAALFADDGLRRRMGEAGRRGRWSGSRGRPRSGPTTASGRTRRRSGRAPAAPRREGGGGPPTPGPPATRPPTRRSPPSPRPCSATTHGSVADEDARERLDWLLRMTMSNYSTPGARPTRRPWRRPWRRPRARAPGRPRRGPRRGRGPRGRDAPHARLDAQVRPDPRRAPPRAAAPPDTNRTINPQGTSRHDGVTPQGQLPGLPEGPADPPGILRPDRHLQGMRAHLRRARGARRARGDARGRGDAGPGRRPGGGLAEAREEEGAAFRRGEAALGAQRPLPARQGAVPGPPRPLRSPRGAASPGRRAPGGARSGPLRADVPAGGRAGARRPPAARARRAPRGGRASRRGAGTALDRLREREGELAEARGLLAAGGERARRGGGAAGPPRGGAGTGADATRRPRGRGRGGPRRPRRARRRAGVPRSSSPSARRSSTRPPAGRAPRPRARRGAAQVELRGRELDEARARSSSSTASWPRPAGRSRSARSELDEARRQLARKDEELDEVGGLLRAREGDLAALGAERDRLEAERATLMTTLEASRQGLLATGDPASRPRNPARSSSRPWSAPSRGSGGSGRRSGPPGRGAGRRSGPRRRAGPRPGPSRRRSGPRRRPRAGAAASTR